MGEQRIYVACLASYNNGKLYGAWLDVEDVDDIKAGIHAMLMSSPDPDAEEWAIHDSEGLGAVSEHEDLAELVERAEFLREHDDVGMAALKYLGSLDQAREAMDRYYGEFRDTAEWAESWADETGMLDEVPENLRQYFDFEAWANDAESGGDIYTIDAAGGVYVFGSSR